MDDKNSKNTKKANEAAVRLFERFLVEKGWIIKEDSIADAVQSEQHCQQDSETASASATLQAQPIDWISLSRQELAEILVHFYAEVRSQKKELYKKTTMNSIRSGLNRHLNSRRRHRGLDTMDLVQAIQKMFSILFLWDCQYFTYICV